MGAIYNLRKVVFYALVISLGLMLSIIPTSAKAQFTTFAVDKHLCLWTNAPTVPNPATCALPSDYLSQVAPGQPAFYLVTITGNANPWTLTLSETYPPGFQAQDVRCAPSGFVASPATATTLGPIQIAANQTLQCTMAGYFITNTNIGTSATNTVKLADTATGTAAKGEAKVTATVLTAATLPTDLSITKTPSTNSVALGGTVKFTLTLSNSLTGKPVYVGGFLQLYDQLLRVGSMALTATLTGPPVCTPSGGAQCVTLISNTSPIALATYWQTLATGNYPSGNSGFLPAGGSMTVVYELKIESTATCVPAGTRGLRNLAGFNLAGQQGTAIAEADPKNNQTDPTDDPSSLVTVTTPASLLACPPGSGNPSVSVTKVVQNPQTTWLWGSTVTYNVTFKNNSPVLLSGISLQDWVSSNYSDTAIVATVVGSPTCSPPCGTSTPGSKVFGYSSANIWNSGVIAPLAPGGTITVPITVKYDMDSCAVESHTNWRITNQVNVYFSTTASSFSATASVGIDMEEPPLCRFKVVKTFQGGAPATLHFNTPYQYQVTYTNQSAKSATVYTLGDALRIDVPGYAASLPLTYSYSCTSPASPSVTGYSPQSLSFPAMSSGSVLNTSTPVNGSQLISLAAKPIKFDAGATLTCTINIVVQRPATGDPNCMGTGAASLQNTAMLYPGSGYYPWAGVPADTDLWSTQKAKLPLCFNLIVNKVADPLAALGTGPPLAYTVTVTNKGDDPIAGLAAPDWLTVTDLFADNYSPGTATATVSNPAGDCGTSSQPNFNCELTGASGNPISLGIKNLARDQTITVAYTLAPPFATERVRNDVVIAAEGTLATDWYAKSPENLSNLNEVPITNPATEPAGGSVLKVCKVAGEGVEPGTRFEFSATGPGAPLGASVPAGPPPGGYCQVVGEYAPGTEVVLAETGPPGYDVTSINVEGPASMPGPIIDLPRGTVGVTLGPGVTEATFTNYRGTGFVEICKTGGRDASYEFSYVGRDGIVRRIRVPTGACSPALEVPAGNLLITELLPAPQVSSVQVWPANRLVKADPSRGQVAVQVPAGNISTQTIISIKNKAAGPVRNATILRRPEGD